MSAACNVFSLKGYAGKCQIRPLSPIYLFKISTLMFTGVVRAKICQTSHTRFRIKVEI